MASENTRSVFASSRLDSAACPRGGWALLREERLLGVPPVPRGVLPPRRDVHVHRGRGPLRLQVSPPTPGAATRNFQPTCQSEIKEHFLEFGFALGKHM